MFRAPAFARLLPVLAACMLAGGTFAVRAAWAEPTLVVRWNDVLLECIRRSKIGPPMVARAIGVTHTCGYDAWAMYDDVAVPTQLRAERRPAGERTDANRQKAFSFAEYHALLDIFPGQVDYIRQQMTGFGYDPDDNSTDPATASGLGTICAKAVTDFRHGDGANQLGDLHPGPYTDYTGYVPVNTVDRINDPNRWQPLEFCDGKGGFVSPAYVAPHWGHVVPFALTSWDQFRLEGPKQYPEGRYHAQAEEILQLNAHITDEQKMIAEYWADGPRSELPPGHFTLFAEFVSNRDHHSFDDDVKMFFILGNAELDAGIAVWGAKRAYDSERPITAIHFLKAGKSVLAYVPFKGPQVIDGKDWMPYQPCNFVTPPFPEYPSGHSAFSAAGAEILKRFSGSDVFGGSVTFKPGSGRVEPGFAPAHQVTLSWATFSEAADQAGLSRRLGGIHFEDGDLDSRRLGRLVAGAVWDRAQAFIHGRVGAAQPVAKGSTGGSEPAGLITGVSGVTGQGVHVTFALAAPGRVRASVLDIQGRTVARLADATFAAGTHELVWRGWAPAGMYFARVEAAGRTSVRRVAVVH
jgi:uncharacterized protein DUF6851/vanadium-dependent haloperoxidase-like protein